MRQHCLFLRLAFARKAWALVALQIYSLLICNVPLAMANPTDGLVVAGSAAIASQGATTIVNQSSDRAIINWQGFSIGAGEVTRFNQPGASAAILNRVTGGDPSSLLGQLQSNGRVFLINPNGIVVGEGARIDVGGFVASTLDVSNAQFMQGGDLNFTGASTASIINRGTIHAVEGDIYLIGGGSVENHGVMQAASGTVGMAAGDNVLLVDSAHQHLVVRPSAASVGTTGVVNTGLIDAVAAELAAHGNVYALAINNEGTIRATGSETRDGHVYLTAGGGGTIKNSGDLVAKNGQDGGRVTIDAGAQGSVQLSGSTDVAGAAGGSVDVFGGSINLSSATIDASGQTAGGQVRIGGDYQGQPSGAGEGGPQNAQFTTVDAASVIHADAAEGGDGGRVIVWADDTTSFHGALSARGGSGFGNGGLAEISGAKQLDFSGAVDLGAAAGEGGALLLDPASFVIGPDEAFWIVMALNNDTNVTVTTQGHSPAALPLPAPTPDAQSNLTVANDLIWSGRGDLSLLAEDNLYVQGNILSFGRGDILLVAGWDGLSMPFTPAPLSNWGQGNVVIDSGITGGDLAVAATRGDVTVYTGDLLVAASDSHGAVLGSQNGDTRVYAQGDVHVDGGGSFAQIGYNGNGTLTGDISVDARGRVLVTSGEHGAAQIGHGGGYNNGNIHSDIDIVADGGLTVRSGDYGHAQVGHGGQGWDGQARGDIHVNTQGDILVQADGDESSAILGHGGPGEAAELQGDIQAQTYNGRFEVTAHGREATAQVGHGGSGFSDRAEGDILVETSNGLGVAAIGDGSSVQIGHGGPNSSAKLAGDISVNSYLDGGLHVEAAGDHSTVQIGHGGPNARGDADHGPDAKGDISLVAENSDLVIRTTGDHAATQVGHGGRNYTGDVQGDITVESGGYAFIEAADSARNSDVQIGHGGRSFDGRADGFVHVLAYESTGLYANGVDTTVRVGHGGVDSQGRFSGETSIRVLDQGNLDLVAAGCDSDVQLGHGGRNANFSAHGDILADAADSIFIRTGGFRSQAQVGHGGYGAEGCILGDIVVKAHGQDLRVDGGGAFSTAMIGHGGRFFSGQIDGYVYAGGKGNMFLETDGCTGYAADAQIGHGGRGFAGCVNGDIFVQSLDNLALNAHGPDSSARIGHGGPDATGHLQGEIFATADNSTIFMTAGGCESDVQIGHGGRHFHGSAEGGVNVSAGYDLLMNADGRCSTVQIGHGGRDAKADVLAGEVTVGARHDIELVARGRYSDVQIGHGGRDSCVLNLKGDVWTITGRNLKLWADCQANSQIGNGGLDSLAACRSGDVVVAWDQNNPLCDEGGRFFMNRNSRIDAGGICVGNVYLFGTRRLGNQIEDCAWINGVRFDHNLPKATLTGACGAWNTNYEFFNWNHEQWGYTLSDLLDCNSNLPYTSPFCFYYLGPAFDQDLLVNFPNPYDVFERYDLWQRTINEIGRCPCSCYRMYYNGAAEQPWEEYTGWTSPDLFIACPLHGSPCVDICNPCPPVACDPCPDLATVAQ